MSSVVIGLLLVLIGAGGFALSTSVASVVPVVVGATLAVLGRRIMTHGSTSARIGTVLAISTVTMIFTASAMPRLAKLLLGAVVERPGDIFVIGTTAVLCLIHVTLSVRTLIRTRSTS
jgi:hypothetical protein